MTTSLSEFSCLCARVGFSQQDAANQFSVRLDTIKKWQQGKMLVPDDVDFYIRRLARVIDSFAKSYMRVIMSGDNDDVGAEFFIPPIDDPNYSLPNSLGFRRVLAGAIIQCGPTTTSFSITSDYDHFTANFFDTWEEANVMDLEYDPIGECVVDTLDGKRLASLLDNLGPTGNFKITNLAEKFYEALKKPQPFTTPYDDNYSASSTFLIDGEECSVSLELRAYGFFEDSLFVPEVRINGLLMGLPLVDGISDPEDQGDNYALGEVIQKFLREKYRSESDFIEFHSTKNMSTSSVN